MSRQRKRPLIALAYFFFCCGTPLVNGFAHFPPASLTKFDPDRRHWIPIVLHKEIDDTTNEDYENHPTSQPKYRSGFRVGGGIDQDLQKCPYGFTDTGAYVTFIYPQSPAEESGLKVNDKLIQINGHDLQFATHKKIVEIIHRYPVLNMLIHRASKSQPPNSIPMNGRNTLSSANQNGHYGHMGQQNHPPQSNYAPNPYPQFGGRGGR